MIHTFGCNKNPVQASKNFTQIRRMGTGKNEILSQHFIQSFSPDEVTQEKALKIGIELCDKFLKGEYQYYLAVHKDKEHIHLHCIFNNVNMFDGRTVETHENQGKITL
ncbi:MAG: relaxase/mobilization nuclease domain-containing protein [Ruminococcus sp.]|nr:relaxase/mobilization nuclease domain-containing protein [Ruminococcus sp.]